MYISYHKYFVIAADSCKYDRVSCTVWKHKPAAVVGPGIVATAVSTATAVIFCRIMNAEEGEMKLLSFLSDMMIPVFMLYIILWGLFAKRDVYNDFLDGAKDGLKTVAGICPALIGLLTGVGILRGSGFWTLWEMCWESLTSRFWNSFRNFATDYCEDVFFQCSAWVVTGYF